MSFGALAARAGLMNRQKKNSACQRCGENYDQRTQIKCPACGYGRDEELDNLYARKRISLRDNKLLGIWFLSLALTIGVVVVLIASF